MKSFIQIFTICAMMMVAISPVIAEIHNVPAEYGTIQAGLDASASGDTVLVQPETYVENIVWPLVNGIKLIAAGDMGNTFIDGDNVDRVIEIISDGQIDAATLIQGFTIQNGVAVGGVYPNYCGGGILCYTSSPTISNCTISGNSADFGGGIDCLETSNPTISNCNFSSNVADDSGGGIAGYSNSDPTISNCTISGNSATNGGGISFRNASPVISYCTISGNSADYNGGGISFRGLSSIPMISN